MIPLKRTYHTVINDLAGDQRLQRVCATLYEAGFEPVLIGRELADSPQLPQLPYRTHRIKVWFHRGKLAYLEYNLRLLGYLLRQPAGILNPNDLDTLGAGWAVSWLRRLPLVYDSHEYYTEVPELIGRPLTRRIWLALERMILPRLRWMYTVNDSLAGIYHQLYGIPVVSIRNLPMPRPAPSHAPRARILLYQGAVNVGRGIDLMIRAMEMLPGYELWIVGRGDVLSSLQTLTQTLGLEGRVRWLGFVSPADLPHLTAQACLGLSLEEDLGANYRYASPNKVYDYIQAHTPVLVSDLPEMQRLVSETGTGRVLTVAERTPAQLATAIRALVEDERVYALCREACVSASQELVWTRERGRLLYIYEQAAGLKPGLPAETGSAHRHPPASSQG
ncbi:MAG: glycosyltransferase [Bacteroidia bacterium]|nr:glycosyltransferase [Bacteroidia bacterium]